jgi:hypothetical protein
MGHEQSGNDGIIKQRQWVKADKTRPEVGEEYLESTSSSRANPALHVKTVYPFSQVIAIASLK